MSSIIHSMSPMYPEERVSKKLHELSSELFVTIRPLLSAPHLSKTLQPLLRAMNSYYTNRIEGQNTRPADIERALKKNMDADEIIARKQRLALVHLECEEELEDLWSETEISGIYNPELVQLIHRTLYNKLPEKDRITEEGISLEPGELRNRRVSVGRHLPPDSVDLLSYLKEWGAFYSKLPPGEKSVIGAAAAHHRLTWIHPFSDGNGRTARLHTHLVLHRLGLTNGMWSVMRGLARNREEYYTRLNNADLPRRNDLDGRGELSQEELVRFIEFFLVIAIDQASFMSEMLRLDRIKQGIRDLLLYLSVNPFPVGSEISVIKEEGLEALHYVAITGPLERGKFMAMTGLPERTARRFLASLLEYGVLLSDSSRAPVQFHVPFKSLRFLFPHLWPEAEVDVYD